MQDVISWIKNNTQTIYLWIGRLTVLFAILVICYIVIRAIVSLDGFGFDPILYALLVAIFVLIQRKSLQIETRLAVLTKKLEVDTKKSSNRTTKRKKVSKSK
jgi:hypothetical protein